MPNQRITTVLYEEELAFFNRVRGEFHTKTGRAITNQQIMHCAIRKLMLELEWNPDKDLPKATGIRLYSQLIKDAKLRTQKRS